MAKIDHIETISDKLAETTIAVLPKRCSYIRNWNSKCDACLKACPHDSIVRSLGQLEIDSQTCTNCGACTAVCPTGALVCTQPRAAEIVKEAQLSAKANEGHAVFACSRAAQLEKLDTEKLAVLPCLDYLDEYLITGLFAFGVKSATLIRSTCANCPVNNTGAHIDETVASAKQLLKDWAAPGHIRLTEKIPMQVRPSRKRRFGTTSGQSRRESFRQAGGSLFGFVAQTVSETVENFAESKPKPSKRAQIIVRPEEVFPPDTYRSVRMLAMLDHIGTHPENQVVNSRLWADVRCDDSACRRCGACAKMCVTRALRFEEDEAGMSKLTFRPSLCTNCMLCKDSCLTHSMVYSTSVRAEELDDSFERVLFAEEQPKKKGSFFS